jgi:cysteine-rich repeat protein
VHTVRVRRNTDGEIDLGPVDPGRHYVYARAFDDGCDVVAAGCAPTDGGGESIVVVLERVDGPECGSGCDEACVPGEATCGDGVLAAEPCDDGNAADGDGCSVECTVEGGYTCGHAEPSTCTTLVSCDAVRAAGARPTGPALLRPDFMRAGITVWCDVDGDAGFALVMRGRGGETSGWASRDRAGPGAYPTPDGPTFKYADSVIGSLATMRSFRIEIDAAFRASRHNRSDCSYDHATMPPSSACGQTADADAGGVRSNVRTDVGGIADFTDAETGFVATRAGSSWILGDGRGVTCRGEDRGCDFTLWAR